MNKERRTTTKNVKLEIYENTFVNEKGDLITYYKAYIIIDELRFQLDLKKDYNLKAVCIRSLNE